MRVLGLIPARFQSSRFPGKPLIDLKGKTMIQRVYEGASQCEHISKIVVATDDVRIENAVLAFGGQVVMTEAKHLTGTDRCAEVAKIMTDYDVVINIQGDEPLVNPKQLDLLISLFQDEQVKIGTLVTAIKDLKDLHDPNRIKCVLNKNQEAQCFSRSPLPSMLHDSNIQALKHIGLYGFRRETLLEIAKLEPCDWEKSESLEQLRWLYNGYKIKVQLTEIETPNIDTPEDVLKILSLI